MTIPRLYNGPPQSAHGGYVAGLLAEHVDGPAMVTLHRPPPLEVAMSLRRGPGPSVMLGAECHPIAHAYPALGWPPDVPAPPDLATALAAGRAAPYRDPARHPHPRCFACGSGRESDGLGIIPGVVPDRSQVADVWVPSPPVAGREGMVAAEFGWAALDCPGGFAAMLLAGMPPIVLGRITVWHLAPIAIGEPVLCTGWVVGRRARTVTAGSALFTATGALLASASTVWVTVRQP